MVVIHRRGRKERRGKIYLFVTTQVVRLIVQTCFSFHQLTLNPWPRPGFPLPLRRNSWRRIQCDRFKNAYQVAPPPIPSRSRDGEGRPEPVNGYRSVSGHVPDSFIQTERPFKILLIRNLNLSKGFDFSEHAPGPGLMGHQKGGLAFPFFMVNPGESFRALLS